MGHFLLFPLTHFLLVLSHVSNSVSSFYAFSAVGPSNTNAPIFTVLLSPHPHIASLGSAVAWWLMPRTPYPEVGGSSLTRVKPCCVLEQGTFTPQKVLVIPRKRWLRPNMTEKLFTGTLRINQPTNHISQTKVPTPISVFLFSFSFNFPQNASIFKENLPEGQIMTSHNTFGSNHLIKKINFLPLGCTSLLNFHRRQC